MMSKILIVGPAWIGDMVMAQTLFKLLKKNDPNCIIDVLAPNWSFPLLERMPEVNKAIAMPIGHGQIALKARYQIGKNLRHENYQQAIVLPNSFKSALIPWFAKIPQRTGWRGEMRYSLINDMRILDKAKYPLMIQRFAALGIEPQQTLASPLPYPELIINKNNIPTILAKHQLTQTQSILALCPGAQFGAAKRWPAKHFAAVAQSKLQQNWQVWLFGGKDDSEAAAEIQQLTSQKCFDLTGKTSLAEALDLLSLATQVVSNDSGLMHVSAALQRPLVVTYGSSDPNFTPPLSNNVKILSLNLACSPCFKRECPLGHLKCLNDLTPIQVLEALSSI